MKIRIGIDVGGTFTHAVAIDNGSLEVLEIAVTPTTHTEKEGVAAGVVKVFSLIFEKLLARGVKSEEIIFVAHSTTQATNALLEGDVSSVGIIALGSGLEGVKVKADANIPDIEVSAGRFIKTHFSYLDSSSEWKSTIETVVDDFVHKKTGCIVAAEAFSVDNPANEDFIKEIASRKFLPACGTHEMSGLYGLRIRTKTAVINASILPKMVDTAVMTENGLLRASVKAPLMVMRSDGGVMSAAEMKRRPLLTLLSGPAAGIAAALTYIRATDALFLEVGGTSTDITVIKNGRATIRSAVIGGHTTYMKTLDSRTVGVGGGSMVELDGRAVKNTGPRSAHIAGLKYVSFSEPSSFEGELKVSTVVPLEGDSGYLAIENEKGERFAVTMSCAANFLGYIKEGDYPFGNQESIKKVFALLERSLGKKGEIIAREILDAGTLHVVAAIKSLISDYSLSEMKIKLIGGGGGACAVVPYVAEKMKMEYEISQKAEVISAIGAAMAMLRDSIEKNIFSPSAADIEQIKREASESVILMGAHPESVDVQIEVDSQKNIVRAIATGSIDFKVQDLLPISAGRTEKRAILARYFDTAESMVNELSSTGILTVYDIEKSEKKLFGLLKSIKRTIAVVDPAGSIKLQIPSGSFYSSTVSKARSFLAEILEKHREYGDAGAVTKGVWLIYSHKMVDFTSIGDEEKIISLVDKELSTCRDEETVSFIAL